MAQSDALALSGAERKPAKQILVLTVLLLVLCQSQQVLASGGISLFLPLIRRDVGLDRPRRPGRLRHRAEEVVDDGSTFQW
ncbi:MAG TPA: hypothetical protein VHD63_25320 [Ktedonobacteraceae bacterium]|jgi:hypothetical protein|nr:hypothetical protein [Ktedonobacteraceae bacterium]